MLFDLNLLLFLLVSGLFDTNVDIQRDHSLQRHLHLLQRSDDNSNTNSNINSSSDDCTNHKRHYNQHQQTGSGDDFQAAAAIIVGLQHTNEPVADHTQAANFGESSSERRGRRQFDHSGSRAEQQQRSADQQDTNAAHAVNCGSRSSNSSSRSSHQALQ